MVDGVCRIISTLAAIFGESICLGIISVIPDLSETILPVNLPVVISGISIVVLYGSPALYIVYEKSLLLLITTLPSSIAISVITGISSAEDASFVPDVVAQPKRSSTIKIDMHSFDSVFFLILPPPCGVSILYP